MTDYQPIACALHDRLEAWAVGGVVCRVVYVVDRDEPVEARGRIADLTVANGEEHLVMADGTRIRLDRIRAVTADGRTVRFGEPG